MKFAGSESLPRVEHFACGGFPSGMEHFHIRWIPFPAGVFCMRQVYLLPAGAFCMRQLRGGEAFIVAKAMLSRSPPPGHAAVLRCGMCCFAGEVMYSTVLVVVGCADMSGCSTVISLLTNTNTISHNLSIHITSCPPL